MSRTAFAIAGLLASAAAAQATISADLTLWSEGNLPVAGTPYVSYRVWVHVTDTPPDDPNGYTPGPDDWTHSELTATAAGGTFYNHPFNDTNPPDPNLFPFFPESEFTTYYTSPLNNPIGEPPIETPTLCDYDWGDVDDTGNGDFVIAQLTVLPDQPDWLLTIDLLYSAANSGGDLFAAHWEVPEPGTLGLLALGCLAATRRRR